VVDVCIACVVVVLVMIDWTMKLWSLRDSRPLLSLEDNSDYV